MFTTTDSVSVESLPRSNPTSFIQPLARNGSLRNIFNRILNRGSDEVDVEAAFCRPPQDFHHATTTTPLVGTSTTRWIERCSFSINGNIASTLLSVFGKLQFILHRQAHQFDGSFHQLHDRMPRDLFQFHANHGMLQNKLYKFYFLLRF